MSGIASIIEDQVAENAQAPGLEVRSHHLDKLIVLNNVAYVAGEAKPNAYNDGEPVENLLAGELATFEGRAAVGYVYAATRAATGHAPQDAVGVVNIDASRSIICANDGITGMDPNTGEILGHRSGALAREALEMLGGYDPANGTVRGYLREVIRHDLLAKMEKEGDMYSDTLMQFADIRKTPQGKYEVDFYAVGRQKDLGYAFIMGPNSGLEQDFSIKRPLNAGILASAEASKESFSDVEPGSFVVICTDGLKKQIPA